jgi:dTDP-4-amino-4,6-dideoxygalactose transaminase
MLKRTPDDLALFGGPPAFAEPLHVGRPNIGSQDAFFDRVRGAFDRRWLTNNGPLVQELERRLAAHVGVAHCIAVCNATVGLEVAIRAAGLSGEVLVPSFTFVATAHALEWIGLTPVFCDVDPRTHNIDPADAARRITDRTTGILGVHVWGRPCDVAGLERLAQAHALTLLFDAAHGLGASAGGQMIGGFGRAEVFSFHATKFFNSLEGGAIVTNDDELARRVRLMINFGFAGYDQVECVGTNAKMNEVAAAMGLSSLEAIETFIAVNRGHYDAYSTRLGALPGIRPVLYDARERNNYQYVVVEIDPEAGVSRDLLHQVLWKERVLARRYFYPACHQLAPYSARPGRGPLPHTEALVDRVLSLPTGTGVSADDVARVTDLIAFVLAHGEEVSARARGDLARSARP